MLRASRNPCANWIPPCVGDYRILTRIDDETIRILVIRIARRRDIYQ